MVSWNAKDAILEKVRGLILFRSSEAAKLRPVFVFLIPGAVDGGYGGEDNLQGLQLVAPQVGRIS